MKSSLLIIFTSILLLGCSNSKKTVINNSQESPEAELQLAPGHIQAMLQVISVEETDSQKIVSVKVLEILNYGSSTDPVPSGTMIEFAMNNDFSKEVRSKVKANANIKAVLFHQSEGMMVGEQKKSNYWKLISINN